MEDAHDQECVEEFNERDEQELGAAADGVTHV